MEFWKIPAEFYKDLPSCNNVRYQKNGIFAWDHSPRYHPDQTVPDRFHPSRDSYFAASARLSLGVICQGYFEQTLQKIISDSKEGYLLSEDSLCQEKGVDIIGTVINRVIDENNGVLMYRLSI